MLSVTGTFALDPKHNPPRLRSIGQTDDGSKTVEIGTGISLRLGDGGTLLESLLDLRVHVDVDVFEGLGNVTDACTIFCTSNTCRQAALRSGRPRMVAKVVGIDADQPRYVLLNPPPLLGTGRQRRETPANRKEAGLAPWVLIEPGKIACHRCPNVGQVAAT
jgi:hypothetical protein